MSEEYPWRDADVLRAAYYDERLSQSEIAERWGTTQSTISDWMARHEIEPRPKPLATSMSSGPLRVTTNPKGHEVIRTRQYYETLCVLHHRLLAVAKYDFDNVSGKVVHHRNSILWYNRYSNLSLLTDSEHKQLHANDAERDSKGRFA